MNASLEVPVAAQDCGDDETVLVHCLGDGLGQRAAVTDASGAAKSDEVEMQGFEVAQKVSAPEVIDNSAGAGGEARLDVRRDGETALDGVAGKQPGAEHDGRVRGVGAARDSGDYDGAVG